MRRSDRGRVVWGCVWLVVAAGGAACDRRTAQEPASSAPPLKASVVLPLGPAPPVDAATGVDARSAPRIDAWGQTVAIAWIYQSGAARVTISPHAGRTFRTHALGGVALPASSPARPQPLAIAVRAPSDLSLPSNDGQSDSRVEVWYRVGDDATARVRRSTNGGRTFDAPVPADVSLSDVFPDPWEPTSATTRESLALLPPPPLRYVGVQKTARPAAALDEGLPPMTLDEHGALAMIWRERTATGEARVLRRYAVDWNGADATTPEFDAAMTIIPDADVLAPAMTRVPGGIVAMWVTNGAIRTRRVGLDMSCNPNRVR